MICSRCGHVVDTCPKCGYKRKARTTGPYSQGNHLNGHIYQICKETGNDFETVKLWCKRAAMAEGYPYDKFHGVAIPWSETRIDTIQAAILIETIHRLGAELNIIFKEE